MSRLFKPLLLQSLRSGGLYVLLIAMILAIAATTALKFCNDQIQQAIRLQAAQMLAADLVLSDSQPIAKQWSDQAANMRLNTSQVTVFSSMAHSTQQFVMVNVKAIEPTFPLRGQVKIAPYASAIKQGEVWLSPRVVELLHVKLGDQVHIADGQFKFTGVIDYDSNQELGFSGFSPTVMIHDADISSTQAIQVGSRIEYRLLLAGAPQALDQFKQYFEQSKSKQDTKNNESLTLKDASQSNTRLIQPVENLDTFLQLGNILTILLCGIAIALTSQRYVLQNQDTIALLRCVGARKKDVLTAYFSLLAVIGLISVILGALLGVGLGFALLHFMLQLIPQLSLGFSLSSVLLGALPIAIFSSLVLLIGFIVPSVLELLRTPPIRVIRQQARSKKSWIMMFGFGLMSLIVFCIVVSQNILLSAFVLFAISLFVGLLYSMIWVMLKTIKAARNRLSAYVRIPYQTAGQVTALALGLSFVTVLVVLRTDILNRWQQQLPPDTPNQFVYGLPPFDLAAFQQQLMVRQWRSTHLYPNIRGRLVAKNDQPFSTALVNENNALRRELNLTQASQYPEDNQILEGKTEFTHKNQVSIEAKLAQELGIQIGDQLTFSLPEGQLKAQVLNFRSVEWESFSPNFFFIFSPKTMDENAGSYLGSFYVPEQQTSDLVSLIQQFPNTVFIDVGRILNEVKKLINVLVQIMTLLASLVVLSGILILIACINLFMDERRREVALMRSIGVSQKQLKQMLSIETGLMGLLAGWVACVFSEVISAVVSYKMKMSIQLHPEVWLVLPTLMMVICALIGRYRLGYLTHIPPIQSLRELD